MSILNSYVSTHAHPDASMVEGYCTEEAIESGDLLCNSVLKHQVAIGLLLSRHKGRLHRNGRIGRKSFISPNYNTVLEAHHSILHRLSIMEPLIKQHMNELREHNHGHMNDWLMKEHKTRLSTWLMEQDTPPGETIKEQTINALASRPSRC